MRLLDCRLGMSCSQGRQQAEVHMEQIELTVLVGEDEAVVVATMVAVSDIDHTDSIHACKFETCMPVFGALFRFPDPALSFASLDLLLTVDCVQQP